MENIIISSGSPCHHQDIIKFPEMSFCESLSHCYCQQWEISGYGLAILMYSNLFCTTPDRCRILCFISTEIFGNMVDKVYIAKKKQKNLCLNGITFSLFSPFFFPTTKFLFIYNPERFNHLFYFFGTCQSITTVLIDY